MAEEPLKSFLDPQVAARLMRLPLQARRPMAGTMSGQHKSPHRGSSVEFAEYRKYATGDDIRRLDWRVLARSDRYYMKEYEAETNLRCHVILDCSGSMKFGENKSGHESKLDYGRRLAATLAYLSMQQGDAVGFHAVGAEVVKEIPAKRNPAHLRNIFELMNELQPQGPTGLVAGLHELAEKIRQRALVIVISDFFCPLSPLKEALQHLEFKKHDLAVFQVLNRAEIDFSFDRPIRFQDLESHFHLVTEPGTIRDRYLNAFNEHNEGLRHECAQFKADYRRVVTDESYEESLAEFLLDRGGGH